MNNHKENPTVEAVYSPAAQRGFFRVDQIISEQTAMGNSLISILQAVQNEYRYLPEEILAYIATALDMSPAEVFGVATFYSQFSLEPKGRHIVRMCDGTACHVKGSREVYEAVRRKIGLKDGQHTSADMLFTVEAVHCVGACGLAPVMMIDDHVYGLLTPEAAEKVIEELQSQSDQERKGEVATND